MIVTLKAKDRGHFNHGWLDTYHTFSFGDFYDPAQMGFRSLRVINEDRVQPGKGFGMHGHRDMEIITYVLEGALEHKDSLGNGSIIRPGDLQHMTAGTGVRHSEFNPSANEAVHLYQIWLLPERQGLPPSYDQRAFSQVERRGRLRLVASSDGADGSLTIRQDARLYLSSLNTGESVGHEIQTGRHVWLQVLRGRVSVNGTLLESSDALAISDERHLNIVGEQGAEVMLFDLA
jgi:hypothetical protein